jgi:hypothetical protein
MAFINSSRWLALAVFGVALLGFMPPAHRANAQAQTPDEAEVTGQWWQWILSIPASENPLFDETGADAAVGQPYKGNDVFFLCGVFNASGTVERSITVPEGTAFFFPLVNFVWTNDSGGNHRYREPENLTVPEMYALLDGLIDEVDYVYVTVDGTDLTAFSQRVQSRPFAVRLPDDNVFGAPGGAYAPAVSDGNWFYLPPLTQGTHTLKFGTSAFGGSLVLDITYNITVE